MKLKTTIGLALATALAATAAPGFAQRTISAAQKQAYIDQNRQHEQREAAREAQNDAHTQRLNAAIANARRRGDWAEVDRLHGIRSQDYAHNRRASVEEGQEARHMARVNNARVQ